MKRRSKISRSGLRRSNFISRQRPRRNIGGGPLGPLGPPPPKAGKPYALQMLPKRKETPRGSGADAPRQQAAFHAHQKAAQLQG